MTTKSDLIRQINAQVQAYISAPHITEGGLSGKSKAQLEERLGQLISANAYLQAYRGLRERYTSNQWLARSMGYDDTGIPEEDYTEACRSMLISSFLWDGYDIEEARSMAESKIRFEE